MKTFYIFRHGQSTYNLAGRTQGQTNDSVLTPLGEQQAREVGKKLQGRAVEVILSSPLTRAIQTARLANESLQVPMQIDDRFSEVNVGEIEGLHYTVIQEKYGMKYHKWRSSDRQYENMRFNGGESKKEVRTRVLEGLKDYAEHSPYTCMAVSSHGIMLTQLLIAFDQRAIDVPNGGILEITYDGTFAVQGWV